MRADDLPAVERMYATFDRRDSVNGLPPPPGEKTARWLTYLIDHGHSLVAHQPASSVFVGHGILADSGAGEAELAVFVHQDFRGFGLGYAIARACVEHARRAGYRRLWATASPGNTAAIRMVRACGFQVVSDRNAIDVELELALD
jgi:GNAT superfamily N-acetyltransferase